MNPEPLIPEKFYSEGLACFTENFYLDITSYIEEKEEKEEVEEKGEEFSFHFYLDDER